MKKFFPWPPVAAITVALLSGAVQAQTGNTAPNSGSAQGDALNRGQSVQASAALDMRASRLIGMDVHNMQGRDLGEINDLVIDVNNQRVHYAILGFGGFMGLGEKLFAYPVRSLRNSGDRLLLDVRQDQLERAPGFERNNWPDWADMTYREQVDRHFGPGVAAERPAHAERLVRASELIGMHLNDRQGEEAGEIEDLVVNLGTAQVRYAVLDLDDGWGPDERLMPMPLNTLRVPADSEQHAVLQVPRDKLDMSTGFDEDGWPNLNDRRYRDRVDRQLPAYRPWTNTPNQILGEPVSPVPRGATPSR